MRLPGAENLGIAIFATYLVPPIVLFIPLARVVGALGLFDSWWAAWVDGCGRVSAIWRVVLPASRPGLAISAIFAFSLSMQGYLYAVVYVAPRAEKVVTVGLTTALIRGDIFYWGSLMAGALLVGLPVALLYNFVLDHFIQGLTGAGAP